MIANEPIKSESNFASTKIEIDKIERSCILGFYNYLAAKESIKIQDRVIFISKTEHAVNQYFKISNNLSEVVLKLNNNEKVKIDFKAKFELFEKIGPIDAANIFVETVSANGYLSRDDEDSLIFDIESIAFDLLPY